MPADGIRHQPNLDRSSRDRFPRLMRLISWMDFSIKYRSLHALSDLPRLAEQNALNGRASHLFSGYVPEGLVSRADTSSNFLRKLFAKCC